MKIKGVLFMVLLSSSGCSLLGSAVLDTVNPLKNSNGITATAQVGKENTTDNSRSLLNANLNSKQEYDVEAGTIGSIKHDNSTNFPWWALVMSFVVGILVRPIDFIKDWRSIKNEPKVT